ncbi:MAG TPA: hypothetical protein VF089_02400, partial [Candidatus Binatia bacterium]
EAERVLEGIYVAGWARNASVGLVGVAKQDAERGMKVVNEYLRAKEGFSSGEMEAKIEAILNILDKRGVSFVTKEDVEILESIEHEEARNRKTWDFKFISDDQMLQVIRERKAAR